MAGSVKANSIQLGDSATDSQNFLLTTNVNGTGKLSRGSAGGLGDILVWDANGKLTLAAIPAVPVQSMIRLNTHNVYGSTNTKIPRFNNVVTNQGADITYVDSATLGASFTVNASGVYVVSYGCQLNTADWGGLSINTTQPTVSIGGLSNASEILMASYATTGTGVVPTAWTGYLPSGSIVRPHTGGAALAGGVPTQFTITRVA